MKEGYYWIKFTDYDGVSGPTIAEYTAQDWWVAGSDYPIHDGRVSVLSERLTEPT